MNSQRGRFVWYELHTTDVAAAAAFYGEVVGWQSNVVPMPGGDYRMFRSAQGNNSAVTELSAAAVANGAPPHWLGYLSVDDVDAAVATAVAAGGVVRLPAMDLPTVGRFCILADPQGANIAFFLPEGTPESMHDRMQPGEFCWHELLCDDPAAALQFYQPLTGWQALYDHDMGPDGVYRVFGFSQEDQLGGMFPRPKEDPHSAWSYYIGVADLDAAIARAVAAGGTLANGPMEVPGGARVATLQDPQGAWFSLLGQ
jgi:predicted enzyme related to lactoylglutathione lyase